MVATAVNLSPLPPEVFDAIGPYVHACKMMGSMASQILGHTPKSLKVELAGGLADARPGAAARGGARRRPALPAPRGLLGGQRRVGGLPARHFRHDGPRCASGEYASSVRTVADEVEVAATLFGTEHTPRIISLMGYKIDIAPATHVACVRVCGRARPHRRYRHHSGRRRGQHHHDADRHQAGGVLRARVHECRGGRVRSGARTACAGPSICATCGRSPCSGHRRLRCRAIERFNRVQRAPFTGVPLVFVMMLSVN